MAMPKHQRQSNKLFYRIFWKKTPAAPAAGVLLQRTNLVRFAPHLGTGGHPRKTFFRADVTKEP
jgi:hypothetical protein